jgi:phospholipase/carboxylesterase
MSKKTGERGGAWDGDGFVHRFVPGSTKRGDAPVILVLHGTGGNEGDLLSLGQEIAPGCPILSPRGKVLENAMPRFFRRLAEGVFDIKDLKFRTNELADFVVSAVDHYGLAGRPIVAVGYSNGANIAASMLLLRPEILTCAVLFRAMLPLLPEKLPDLSGKRILISAGLYDGIVPRTQVEKLVDVFKKSKASVTVNWISSDHSLVAEEVERARDFVRTAFGSLSAE